MASYLITGSSRGLGLTLVEQLASLPASQASTIFATARSNTSAALQKLIEGSSGRVVYVQLDTTDPASVKAAVSQVEQHLNGKGLDVLINNAGVDSSYTPDGIHTMTDLNSTLNTNVTGTHNVTSAFLPLLQKGEQKKVFNITSTVGSIAMAPHFGGFSAPAYSISKATLNMLTVQYALSYADQGFSFIAISPGWLQTDMGGAEAHLTVETGAKAVLEAVHGRDKESNGQFIDIRVEGWTDPMGMNMYSGRNLPW